MNALTEPQQHNYPDPEAPVSPIFSSHSCNLKKQPAPSNSILALKHKIYVSSGRAAICLALEDAGIKEGDCVLVPAFHCESMISPVKWCKATPVFYRVKGDTSLDLDDIRRRITPSTKAIIATHYFGFLQDLNELRKVCDQNNIVLIEDCAHAFYGNRHGHNVGEWGDYAVASSMKFFPVYDGGILASNRHPLTTVNTTPPPKLFGIKSIINTLERSVRFQRLGLLGKLFNVALNLKGWLWNTLKSLSSNNHSEISGPGSSDGGYALDENWIHKESTSASRSIILHSDFELNQAIRRKNYQVLESAIKDLPGVKPLYEHLPENVVPLIFPAYIEDPSTFFPLMKNAGIPIWRFGEYLDPKIDNKICSNSTKLSSHVFQFPCHQELTQKELEWMLNTIERILRD